MSRDSWHTRNRGEYVKQNREIPTMWNDKAHGECSSIPESSLETSERYFVDVDQDNWKFLFVSRACEGTWPPISS